MVFVNAKIYNHFLHSDGKTKALFGIVEYQYFYKYYFLCLSIISLIFSSIAIKKKEKQVFIIISFIIFILSVFFVTISFWRIFI